MTPRQVLQVAIEKAERRGFDLLEWWEEYMEGPAPPTPRTAAAALLRQHDWLKLLFSYRFARPLFGDEALDDPEGALPSLQERLHTKRAMSRCVLSMVASLAERLNAQGVPTASSRWHPSIRS